MKTVIIDGKECTVFAERSDEDGGIVTNTLVPAGDGSYYNYRSWRGRGIISTDATKSEETVVAEKTAAQQEALTTFEKLTDADIAELASPDLTTDVDPRSGLAIGTR